MRLELARCPPTDSLTIDGVIVADLVVFDTDRVGPELRQAATDLPAAATRLVQHAIGIHATIVNGEPLLVDGEHTGAPVP